VEVWLDLCSLCPDDLGPKEWSEHIVSLSLLVFEKEKVLWEGLAIIN
jgi:hypothetical protein